MCVRVRAKKKKKKKKEKMKEGGRTHTERIAEVEHTARNHQHPRATHRQQRTQHIERKVGEMTVRARGFSRHQRHEAQQAGAVDSESEKRDGIEQNCAKRKERDVHRSSQKV